MPLHSMRRGPKPKVPDANLLTAIRADLEASPFTGKGHRKVSARLRILSNIRVSHAQVLRLVREHTLLSLHRRSRDSLVLHDRSLQTNPPNAMWDTDGIGSKRWMRVGLGLCGCRSFRCLQCGHPCRQDRQSGLLHCSPLLKGCRPNSVQPEPMRVAA